jgi:transcription initiation factor IIE alpha subunit
MSGIVVCPNCHEQLRYVDRIYTQCQAAIGYAWCPETQTYEILDHAIDHTKAKEHWYCPVCNEELPNEAAKAIISKLDPYP